jgi:iron complex transport system ATP-binding protein
MRIEAQDLTAGYGNQPVLRGVSLKLQRAEFVGLIGPNGAGKSTLLRALTRSMPLQGGTVYLDGESIHRLSARDIARKIALVPQAEPTLFEFTVREVVLMGRHPHIHGLFGEREEDFAIAARAMAATDTLHLADRPITALSGGEHRRALIARALAQNTSTLLLDEPTAHLDITHQTDLLSLIKKLSERDGTAVFTALHDLNLAAEFCDRLILLADGHIQADGSPDEVLTVENLHNAYGVSVQIGRNPVSGRPFLFPTPPISRNYSDHSLKVHIICGGGTGLMMFTSLLRLGFQLSAGVLNRLDSDEDAAVALDIEHVSEAPYSPITIESKEACSRLMNRADAILITEVPFGKGNLANLDLALQAQAQGKTVILLGEHPIESRDFTGKIASQKWYQLIAQGALPLNTVSELERRLSTLTSHHTQT